MPVLCLYGARKSKPRVHLAHVKVLWQMQKFMCYCTVFVFQVQTPGGLYLEGRFNGGFFLRQEFGGHIFGGAYFRNLKVIYEKTKGKFPGEHHVR